MAGVAELVPNHRRGLASLAGVQHTQGHPIVHAGNNLMLGLLDGLESQFRVVLGDRELRRRERVCVRGRDRAEAAENGLGDCDGGEAEEGEQEFHSSIHVGLQRLLQRLVSADENQINGQDDAVVVLHEVAGMGVEGGGLIEVPVEGERAGATEGEAVEGGTRAWP